MSKSRAVIAFAVAIAAFGSTPAAAQRTWNSAGHSSKVRVPDDLGREPLDVAKTALSGGDVDRALSVYQDILDRLPDKLASSFRVPRSGSETDHILPGDRFSGLRDYVAGLIKQIPDGLARYRERESPRAAAELSRALAARDEAMLLGIAIRWELTESGPLALAALSDILYQTGRVTEARLCADRLLALASDAASKPELRSRATLRAAVAHAALRDRDALKALAMGLAGGDASIPVKFGGNTRGLREVVEQLVAAVETTPAPVPVEKTLASFGKPAWQSKPFARHGADDGFGDEYLKFGNQWVTSPGISYFPVIPAVSDAAVYFCDGLRVEGMSLMTGSSLWPDVEAPPPGTFQGSRHWNVLHEIALDRGVLYACLEDQPDMKTDRQHMIMGFKPIETIAVRKLYAVDASTGEVRWTHASPDMARDAEERTFLNRISINTPPLPLGDRLYVGATYYFGGFRQWLCAFERDTGRLVWKTYIGQGQAELNMFGNPLREVVPGYVGESDGLLVYSTNIGAVAAVDAITGMPKWVSAYTQEPVPPNDGQRSVSRAPGWAGQRPLFYAGRAIIAPSDSFDVYTFDLETGVARMIPGTRRTPATPFRHVVGIADDALIIAGRRVHAFDLKPLLTGDDPKPKWEAPPDTAISGDATIDGRPAIAGDRLFYTGRPPISGRRGIGGSGFVGCIDVSSGRILEEKQIEGAIYRGNIVFSPDAIVIAGDVLTAMFALKDVARRLEAAVAKSPDDAELHLRLGQIELQARNIDRAIAAFEKARTLASASGPRGGAAGEIATLALYNLYLELADDALKVPSLPDSPRGRFEKALGCATTTRQQVQVLKAELLWARANGEPDVVRDLANRLINEFAEERIRSDARTAAAMPELKRGAEVRAGLFGALAAAATFAETSAFDDAVLMYSQALARFPDDVVTGASGTMSVWRFAQSRIAELIKANGAGVYAAEERQAAALLEEARQTGNLDALRALLDRHPNSTHVEAAWLELSRRLRELGRDREALRAVQRQLARYGAVTPVLLAELARSLESAGAIESARDVLVTLKDRFPKDSVPAQSGTVDVVSFVDERLRDDRYRELMEPPPIPEGTIGLRPAWTEMPTSPGDEVVLVVPDGRRPKTADAFVLVHKDGELRALDIESGRPKWTKAVRILSEEARPFWHDGMLLCVMDGDLVALDPPSGKENWRAPPSVGRMLAIHAAHGKAYAMVRPPLAGRSVVVRAYDIVSGEKLRDFDFTLTGGGVNDVPSGTSFASSPLWLLCRLDLVTGSNVVLDGVTGEIVLHGATGTGSSIPSMLSSNNLLVTQSTTQAAGSGTAREATLVARNPRTMQVVWNFKIERLNDAVRPVALTPSTGVYGVRFVGTPNGRREIIALDLTNGTTRMSIGLRVHDLVANDGVIIGDLLIAKFQTAGESKRFLRAYDLKKSSLLWDSVTYSGAGHLWVHPTRNYAVVRVSSRETAVEKKTDMIHFFEIRTGLLKDSITLENAVFRSFQTDLDIRDRAMAIRGGPEVSVRK